MQRVVRTSFVLAALVVPAALRAQDSPITVRIAIPLQLTRVHPDIAKVWMSCSVKLADRPAGVHMTTSWSDARSAELSVGSGSVRDTAFVTFTGTATPSAVGQTFRAYCAPFGRLSPTAPPPSDGLGGEPWRPLLSQQTDPRFRITPDAQVLATATIPAAQ